MDDKTKIALCKEICRCAFESGMDTGDELRSTLTCLEVILNFGDKENAEP